MVDVARGADRQRHAGITLRRFNTRRFSPASPPRRPRRSRPPRGCGSPAGASRRGRHRSRPARRRRSGPASSSSSAHAKDGSSASGSAPPPTRATVSSTLPPTSSARRSARARTSLHRLVEHAQHGDLAASALGVEVERERPLERRERQLVGAQRALQRVPPQPLDQVGAPDDDPGLRAAEELVAGEADEIGTRGEAAARGGLVTERHERPGAEVVDERQARLASRPRPARTGRAAR